MTIEIWGHPPRLKRGGELLARLLDGGSVAAEEWEALNSEELRRIGEYLGRLPAEHRGSDYMLILEDLPPEQSWRLAAAVSMHVRNWSASPALGGDEPSASASASDARRQVVMRRASDVRPLAVQWLWRDRLPLGMLSLFAGDPKLGKSFVTLDLAAAVSRGAAMPLDDVPTGPASVILMSAEDDPARTIVPRLASLGATLSRVHILESVLVGREATPPSLRADVDRIAGAVESLADCRLVIIDPISAYLGGVDDHKNGELRGVLSPLKAMAERLNVAVLLVTHLNKAGGNNAKHRVTGSIAYVGACRANFLFARDRRDPGGRRVLMLANGCNLAGDVPTLAYQIDDRGHGPVVVWDAEPVAITAEDALREEQADPNDRGIRRAEADDCADWLRDSLAEGAAPAADLLKFARDAGFSRQQLQRAKQRLGVVNRREGFGPGSRCLWTLDPSPPSVRILTA